MSLDMVGAAKGLTRNPLGIIGLFIVLVYGFASIVTSLSGSFLPAERMILVIFIAVFPVLVLGVFAWLVSQHHRKLYAPSDFRNEENFNIALTVAASLGTTAAAEKVEGGVDEFINIPSIVQQSKVAALRASDSGPRRILWVDDRPRNNESLKRAFEALGIEVDISLTTSSALSMISSMDYSAIISDMGRAEGPTEGYVLLDSLRKRGNKTPFFIYAGSNLQEHKDEATRRKAQGSTNRGAELLDMVTTAIQSREVSG
jgi:CheY-like chemotaxis protein